MLGWMAPSRHRCAKLAAFAGRLTGAIHDAAYDYLIIPDSHPELG